MQSQSESVDVEVQKSVEVQVQKVVFDITKIQLILIEFKTTLSINNHTKYCKIKKKNYNEC